MADTISIPAIVPPLDPDLAAIAGLGVDESTKHLLIETQLSRDTQRTLNAILSLETKMSAQLDALTAQVSQNTTVIESAITLITGFSQRLNDGIAAAQAGDLSKLTDLQTELASEDQKLAAAVAANTQQVAPPDQTAPASPAAPAPSPAAPAA